MVGVGVTLRRSGVGFRSPTAPPATSMKISALLPLSATLLLAATATSQSANFSPQPTRAGFSAAQGPKKPKAATDADFYDNGNPPAAKVELGRMLFFDKVLSGNKNISCATCHHSLTDTGDGLSLPVGEGGRGLGVTRDTGSGADRIHERVPRNAPPVFNLGATSFRTMFHDGRLTVDPSQPSGFFNPAGDDLPAGLDNVLAAQAMFPVTSAAEMAGQPGENPIADAADAGVLAGPGGVWDQLTQRLQAIPDYLPLFQSAYPNEVVSASDITYVQAANAIAAFEASAWRATDSPFDRFLEGDKKALTKQQQRGSKLFYGKANCGSCHSGTFQTDMAFHSIAMPQIGPGKGDGVFGYEDFGRERVTLNPADRYRFRTPTLRNVALTGPWGHSGAYDTLEGVVRHHLDPVGSLQAYDPSQLVLPPDPLLDPLDLQAHSDPAVQLGLAASNELPPTPLSDAQVEDLVAFLHALTDPASIDLRIDVPRAVPSGLTLAE